MANADSAQNSDATPYESGFMPLFVTAQDGLRLHIRAYGSRTAALPVVCLPGLTRNGSDFHELATALSGGTTPRYVIAIDSRGRGGSEYDRNPANYSFPVELGDVLAVLTALEVGRAIFVGTSRGGILTMLLGSARAGAIAGAVLNDVGPVIDPKGLVRIKGYAGKLPAPRSFEEGAEILRRLGDAQFTKLTTADWVRQAQRTWKKTSGGAFVLDYDPQIAKTLETVDLESPMPSIWPAFDSLANVPLMVVRGANSDLLSAATVEEMRARRAVDLLDVPDQGHAPLLAEPDVIARIAAFIALCDAAESRRPA